jgi:hypothetical protein
VTRRVEDEVGAFLARWSRRKAAARRGTPEPEEPRSSVAPDAPAREEGGRPEPRAEGGRQAAPSVPELDFAKLPDPDTLDAASDFSVFMQPGVPAELKRRALRRLWKVNPIISTPDGLDDYYIVNDFSDASTVVADLKTLYRVGRGMVAALDEAEEPAAGAAVAEARADTGDRGTGQERIASPEGSTGATVQVADSFGPTRDPLSQAKAGARDGTTPEGELGRQGSAG